MATIEEISLKQQENTQSLKGGLDFRQSSNSFIISTDQKIFVEISEQGFYYYDNSQKARIILGKHPKTGEVGLWISKPDVDCKEALNQEQP